MFKVVRTCRHRANVYIANLNNECVGFSDFLLTLTEVFLHDIVLTVHVH